MSKRFDAYSEWLNIPPGRRPPDFYDLLGLKKFESSQKVIKTAANTRKSLFENLVDGPRGTRARSLMKEISQAYQILSQPQRKAAYDRRLQHLLSEGQTHKSLDTFIEFDTLSEDSNALLIPDDEVIPRQSELMNQMSTKESFKQQNAAFPILAVLICMGLVTLFAAAGIFALVLSQSAIPTGNPVPVETLQAPENPRIQSPPVVDKPTTKPDETAQQQKPVPSMTPPDQNPAPQVSPPKVAANPPEIQLSPDAIAPENMAKWKSMMGMKATLEGVVVKEGKSSTGKTRYLWFSQDRENVAMVFMMSREVGDELSLEFLASLRGKRVRVTGTVSKQFGTKRLGIKIRKESQIEVVE